MESADIFVIYICSFVLSVEGYVIIKVRTTNYLIQKAYMSWLVTLD